MATGASQAWTTVAVRRLVTRALVLLVLNVAATFAAAVEVVHPAPESAGDTRFEYYWQLLARALTMTEPDFGPYVLRSATSAMTERRAFEDALQGLIAELIRGRLIAAYQNGPGVARRIEGIRVRLGFPSFAESDRQKLGEVLDALGSHADAALADLTMHERGSR